jgi:transposase
MLNGICIFRQRDQVAQPAQRVPPWQSVYYYFRKWSKDATLQKVQQSLLTQLRVSKSGSTTKSGIIDSQTVRTSKLADPPTVGINGHRWIKGRKRTPACEGQWPICCRYNSNRPTCPMK